MIRRASWVMEKKKGKSFPVTILLNRLLLFLLLTAVHENTVAEDQKILRIAHVQWGVDRALPVGFLIKARELGYTHILAAFWLNVSPFKSDWDGRGNVKAENPVLKTALKRLFLQVDAYGLSLIPLFQTGNMHSAHLYSACRDMQEQIRHRSFSAGGMMTYRVPPQSPEYGPMNRVLDGLLSIIVAAHEEAKPQLRYKNLDFIHLGMDEIVVAWGGKVSTPIIAAGLCRADRVWISTHAPGLSSEKQIERLISASLRNKIERIGTITEKYGLNTRQMIWADMFDPQRFGGKNSSFISFENLWDPNLIKNSPEFNLSESAVSPTISNVLLDSEVVVVRTKLLLNPWYYGSPKNYSAPRATQFFDSCGYEYAFFTSGATFTHRSEKLQHYPVPVDRYEALENYVRASRDLSSWKGFGSAHWVPLGFGFRDKGWEWDSNKPYVRPYEWMTISDSVVNAQGDIRGD